MKKYLAPARLLAGAKIHFSYFYSHFIFRLKLYKIDLDKDIIAGVTDRASVMVKFGTLIDPLHFLCMAHGYQLAICDFLYKKSKKQEKEENEIVQGENEIVTVKPADGDEMSDDDESDEETEDEDGTIAIQLEVEDAEIVPEYERIISFVRKCFNKFRNSRIKNGVLQDYIKAKHGKKLKMKGDSKTRWTSLRAMLVRFNKCVNEIKTAMNDFDMDFELNDKDLEDLTDLCNALEPFEVAVKALCRRDSNLLKADTTHKFTIDSLREMDSHISRKLLEVRHKYHFDKYDWHLLDVQQMPIIP